MNIFELIRIYNSMRSYFEAKYHAPLRSIAELLDDGADKVIRKLIDSNSVVGWGNTSDENVKNAVESYEFTFDRLMESERRRLDEDPRFEPEAEQKKEDDENVYIVDKVSERWFCQALEECYRECREKDPSLKDIEQADYEAFNQQWYQEIGDYMRLKYSRMWTRHLRPLHEDDQETINLIEMICGWDEKLPEYKKELVKYSENMEEREIQESVAATDSLHADIEDFVKRVDALHTRVEEMQKLPHEERDQKFFDDMEAVSKEAQEIVREREELDTRAIAVINAARNENVLNKTISGISGLTDKLTVMNTQITEQLEKHPDDLWLGQLSMDTGQLITASAHFLGLKQQEQKAGRTAREDHKQLGENTDVKISTIRTDVTSLEQYANNYRQEFVDKQAKKAKKEKDEKADADKMENLRHLRSQYKRFREVIDCIEDTTPYGKHHGTNHPEYARMLEAVQQYRNIAKEEMLDHPTPEQKQAMDNAYQACKAYIEVHLKRDKRGNASLGGQTYTVGKLRKQAAVCMYECLAEMGADPVEAELEPTAAYKKKHITREDLDSLKASLEASAMNYESGRRAGIVFEEKAYANLEYVRQDHLKDYGKQADAQRVKNDAKNIRKRTQDEEGVKMADRLRETLPKLKLPKNKEQCMAELNAIEKICAESAYFDYKGYYKKQVVQLMDNYYKVKADPTAYTEEMFDQLIATNDGLYMYMVPLRKINNRSVENFKARAEELWAYVQEIKVLNQDPKSFYYGETNDAWSQFEPVYKEYLETSQKEKDIPDAKIGIHGELIKEAAVEPARDAPAARNRNPLHNALYALAAAGKWSTDNRQLPGGMEQVNKSALSYYNAKDADKQACLNHLYSTCIDYLNAPSDDTKEASVCRQAVSGLVQTIYRQRGACPEFHMAASHYEDAAKLSGMEPVIPRAVNDRDAANTLNELTTSYKDLLHKAEGQPSRGSQNSNTNNKGRISLPADAGHRPAKG